MTPEDLDQRFRMADPGYYYDDEPVAVTAWEIASPVLKVAGGLFILWILFGGMG